MNPDGLEGLRALVGRRIPALLPHLNLSLVPHGSSSAEQVTIHVEQGTLHVEADSVSAAGVGIARWLEEALAIDLSWDGPLFTSRPPTIDALGDLPDSEAQTFRTSLSFRYHLNPVTFGYTMAFWGWEQWECHIDWMALHGVTAPLNLVGHDAVLVRMLRDLGVDHDEAARFVGGPAFLPWTTMGITHDIGAALSDDTLAARARLGRRIAERERELGMTVVLPGFGGQLPASLIGEDRTIQWQGWRTPVADPQDPLFAQAAASLHRHQRELLGTDHHYTVDPYIESLPPTTSAQELADHAAAIHRGMRTADPEAVWILQGWPFHYQSGYWTHDRVRSLLSKVPPERLILLDLWGEYAPMWHSTGDMFGRRWLWCLTHSFGGRFGLFGDLTSLDHDLEGLRSAAARGTRGRLEGFGITAESLDDNAVVYELATRALWSPMPPLQDWLDRYVARRWRSTAPEVLDAWHLVTRTLYGAGRTRATPSPLIARPWSRGLPFASQRLAGEALPASDGPPSANLDAENDQEMVQALRPLARAVRTLLPLLDQQEQENVPEALRRDIAQLAMHVGAQSARAPLRAIVAAANSPAGPRRSSMLRTESARLEALILATDSVAGTLEELLLGTWIARARDLACSDRRLADALEYDARSLISVWGLQSSGLHDYSARHWSGSLRDLHAQRWKAWAHWLGTDADPDHLHAEIRRIEEAWRSATDPYPTEPIGDLADAVRHLLDLAEDHISRLTRRITP